MHLTLLSVVSYDYKYFEINYKLTSKLNDKKSFNWLVFKTNHILIKVKYLKKINKKIKKII